MLKLQNSSVDNTQYRDKTTNHLKAPKEYDVFICHASEDKDSIVRALVYRLQENGLKIWYDEFTLKLGDSLREKIDQGLANSRFGVVILSQSFFNKNWPQKELGGLFSKEVNGKKTILPVWHGVSKREVESFSPMLSSKLAISTDKGLDAVVKAILEVCLEY